MDILAFNYEFPPLGGGGGVVFEQIVEELARRHRVTVITSGYEGLSPRERRGALEIHRIPVLHRTSLSTATMASMLSYWPSSLRHGRELMRRSRFDVINSHFAVPSAPSADQLSRRFGVPHVLSVHGGDIFDPSKKSSPHRLPLVRGLVRRLLDRADRVVAQSSDTASNARRFYGVTRPIDVVPLGIRPLGGGQRERAALGIGEDRFVIVTVGRLVARKAVDGLIRAVAALDDPKDLLVIIGDGPRREEWERLASELNASSRVLFAGFVDADSKRRFLASADVFASTSIHEGFGLVFLEAMDQGLPVVAFNRGGQTDFLRDGVTGGLVSLGDLGSFTGALRRLKDSAALRRSIGATNRELVKEYYISRCAERYEEIFDEVCMAKASMAASR